MADLVGQQLGNYRLLRVLGQGMFAAVYLGEHQYLERPAAVKVLHVQIEPARHEAFRREARTIAQLSHPHIIGVHDFGIEDQTPYLVMEYMPNGMLRSRHPKDSQLSFEQIVTYVKQIASALDCAHQQRVIHRDIKPENILLNSKHEVVLSDFGIAVIQHTLDSLSTQNPAGTPQYMAPEQIQRKPCAASDQYALGVMVYEWLCGEPPFRGSLYEVLGQHLHTPPPSLCVRMKELPPAVEDAVFKALAKDPLQRFGNVVDFASALEEAFFVTQPPSLSGSDYATQPRLKTAQHIGQKPDLVSSVSPQPTIHNRFVLMQRPPVHQQARASTFQDQNRVRMLGRLRRSYSDLMNQSLQGAAWLELGLADKPDAVQNATHLLLRVSDRAEQHLPPDTSITQAYDEVGRELLILGEPGSGKSTLLLDLAQQLVMRAEQDPTHPLPVILPLSSWAVKRSPLQDWIAEQLAQIYDVPRKLSMQWVREDGILPLLDGLDEMEATARPACIAAINAYHHDHLAILVVCSRTSEYEAAAKRHRLALQGSVVVQPLTHEDVDTYLVRAGKPLIALYRALKKNAALRDLATTPLLLNILILTYQGTSMRDLSSGQSLLLQQVWDDYVQRMVERKGNSERYPLEQTRSRLGWLAQQMREHNQTVFYLEHLQPDWLSARQQSTYAWQAMRLPAIVIGSLMSILVSLFFSDSTNLFSLLEYGVLGGLLGGLWYGSLSEKESQGEHRSMWRKHLVRRLAVSVCIGLIYGLSFEFSLGPDYTVSDWQIGGLFSAVTVGLSSFLLQYLLAKPFRLGISSSGSRTLGRWEQIVHFFQAVQGPRALLVAVVTGLNSGLSGGLNYGLGYALSYRLGSGLSIGLSIGLYRGLSIGLVYGLSIGLISLLLGAQMGGIHLTERLRWTWRSLRRGLFNSRHLRIAVLLACIITPLAGLSYWLSEGLSNWSAGLSYWLSSWRFGLNDGLSIGLGTGLSIGMSYWFVLGFLQGMAQEQIEDQDRRVANQGTHRSLRNSVMMGIIGGGVTGIIGVLSIWLGYGLIRGLTSGPIYGLIYGSDIWLDYGLSYKLSEGLSKGLSVALLISISGAVLICIHIGGLAVWRHYIVRSLLQRSHALPWRAPQFLNDATARFLLRRVGGGYSFSHRLLLDHFADMETGTAPTANVPPRQFPCP